MVMSKQSRSGASISSRVRLRGHGATCLNGCGGLVAVVYADCVGSVEVQK